MCKFALKISTILALAAMSASGFQVESDFQIQSDFQVADQNSNIYTPIGCTPNGILLDFFWNFNGCTASGSGCRVTPGGSMTNTVAFTPSIQLDGLVTKTTLFMNGGEVSSSTITSNSTMLANQRASTFQTASVPGLALRGSYRIDFEMIVPGQAGKGACGSCVFQM